MDADDDCQEPKRRSPEVDSLVMLGILRESRNRLFEQFKPELREEADAEAQEEQFREGDKQEEQQLLEEMQVVTENVERIESDRTLSAVDVAPKKFGKGFSSWAEWEEDWKKRNEEMKPGWRKRWNPHQCESREVPPLLMSQAKAKLARSSPERGGHWMHGKHHRQPPPRRR